MKICYFCQEMSVVSLIDFGQQPVSHRFLLSRVEDEYLGPLKIGQCQKCGLVQQLEPMPIDELRPRFAWLESTEPERHLDDLVRTIIKLPGISPESKICGLSWKEDTTLARLNGLGFNNTWRLDLQSDLGIQEPYANVETIQERLTFKQSEEIVRRRGKAHIVIARHLIEHAFNVRDFLRAVKNLLHPKGYLILEIPDCQRALENLDYTTIWEEHTLYFTPATFKACFSVGGFRLVDFIEEEYSLENSYIGIAQINEDNRRFFFDPLVLKEELKRARRFSEQLETKRKDVKTYLTNFRRDHGKVAIFGAAHMCVAFINLLKLQNCIEFVVDDNPYKKGMFMPGSRLPIDGSSAIIDQNIKLCLLTLSVSGEEQVLANNKKFIERGGIFKSIFPRNPIALTV